MIKPTWLRGTGALAVVTLLAACHQRAPEDDPVGKIEVHGTTVSFMQGHTPQVITSLPVGVASDTSLSLPGRLVWDEDRTVRVFSPFAGHVAKIVAQLGDRVSAGSPLALISSPDYGSAQADYRKAFANREMTQHAVARARDLLAHGIVAQKDVEQAEADAAAADAEAQRSARVLRIFNDNGDTVTQALTLRSPIEGIVVERAINPGQELRSDQSSAPPFVVTDPRSLWLQLDAREGDLASLAPGATFTFHVATFPSETFAAKIIRVADFVDPVTRTIKVLARVDNTDRRLKGEMFVTATIAGHGAAQPEALAQSVLLLGDKHYVFVRKGDAFERREVAVGNQQAGRIAIVSGVNANDTIVTDGALYLQSLLQRNQG